MSNDKRTIYVGGLADEVTERLLNNAFIPFGDIADIQMPADYESQRHRGFAFIEYEQSEDAAAAIDNMVRSCCTSRSTCSGNTTNQLFPERLRALRTHNSRELGETSAR